ncbi:PqqD family protein [Mesorhizobium atlanticum]
MAEIGSETVLRMADDASVQHVWRWRRRALARSGRLYHRATTRPRLFSTTGERARCNLNQIVDLLADEFEVDKATLGTRIWPNWPPSWWPEGILADPGV